LALVLGNSYGVIIELLDLVVGLIVVPLKEYLGW